MASIDFDVLVDSVDVNENFTAVRFKPISFEVGYINYFYLFVFDKFSTFYACRLIVPYNLDNSKGNYRDWYE